jgi:putative serine protease PepD
MRSFADVVEAARPSVVHLVSPGVREAVAGREGGSGFLVAGGREGLLITNEHVLAMLGGEIEAIAHDDERAHATLVASEASIDLALLTVDLPTARPGVPLRVESPRIGEAVIAMGSSFGFEAAVTSGILSSVDVSHAFEYGLRLENLLVTDALIGHGNSGGPLLDDAGRAIGVTSAIKRDEAEDPSGFGFAIPAPTLQLFVDDVLATGVWRRGTLRLHTEVRPLRAAESAAAGGAVRGLAVLDVLDPGPTGGRIRPGDTLVSAEGAALDRPGALLAALSKDRVGRSLTVDYLRDGAMHEAEVRPVVRI